MLGVRAAMHEHLPHYEVEGGSFHGGHARLSGERSSQFLSSLLMVAPYAKEATTIDVEGHLASTSYVEMTMEVMKRFAVEVGCKGHEQFSVRAGQHYGPAGIIVEPDVSSASYFLAAAAIGGGEVVVEGLGLQSLQGDIGFARLLRDMGCDFLEVQEGLKVRSAGRLRGIDVDMNAMPDVVPTLAVAALFAEGTTRIRNVGHLRYKESDRLSALATELPKLGARIAHWENGLEITPAPLHGAELATYGDHRLAMSFALVGLRVPGVKIENPDCVRKSFPTFWVEFEKLYDVTQRR
jgi:3-phosphoshikimate 1-carboxyvinyltransferase